MQVARRRLSPGENKTLPFLLTKEEAGQVEESLGEEFFKSRNLQLLLVALFASFGLILFIATPRANAERLSAEQIDSIFDNKYQQCKLPPSSFGLLKQQNLGVRNQTKPIWLPMYPDAVDASVVRGIVEDLTGLSHGGKVSRCSRSSSSISIDQFLPLANLPVVLLRDKFDQERAIRTGPEAVPWRRNCYCSLHVGLSNCWPGDTRRNVRTFPRL
jgi:hypothetical protein